MTSLFGGFWGRLAVCCVVLTLAGCPHAFLGHLAGLGGQHLMPMGRAATPLKGQLHWKTSGASFKTQATMTEVASASTVSLIQAEASGSIPAGTTRASTVTDASGSFTLSFGSGFVPDPTLSYYVEAVKGLSAGGLPNRAGASIARIRTVVAWNGSGWLTLTQSSLIVDPTTTALAIICSLRGFDPLLYIGSLNPTTQDASGSDIFTAPVGSQIAQSDLDTVVAMVDTALSANEDPVYVINYNTSSGQYTLTPPSATIELLTPSAGPIGATIQITGQGFDPVPTRDQVLFNGTAATSYAVNQTGTIIQATVPVGATSGPITVVVDGAAYTGGVFTVQAWDGHVPFDSNLDMYVAAYGNNTVWEITPSGVPELIATDAATAPPGSASGAAVNAGLGGPQGVVVDPAGDVFVSNWTSGTITKLATGSAWTASTFASGLSNPSALAIDASGDIYVANYGGGNVEEVSSTGAPINANYATGVGSPRGLAFDQSGNLYVSGYNQGTVYKVPAGGGAGVAYLTNLSDPWGLAFDSLGDLYVANYGSSALYEVPVGTTQPLNVPGLLGQTTGISSVAVRSDGALFVGAYDSHSIFDRLQADGGMSSYLKAPRNIWSMVQDTSGDLFIGTQQINNKWETRFFNNAITDYNLYKVPYLGSGNYGPFEVLATGFSDLAGLAINPTNNELYGADGSDNLYEIDPTTGHTSLYASTLPTGGTIGQMAFDNQGNLWMVNWRNDSNTNNYYTSELTAGGQFKQYWSGRRPWGVAFDGTNYYVAMQEDGLIVKVAGSNPTATCSLLVNGGISNPQVMAYDSAGPTLYVASANNTIYEINPSTGAVTGSWSESSMSDPYGMVLIGSDLFVSNLGNGTVTSYSASSGALQNTIALPSGHPSGLAEDASGNLYIATYEGTLYEVTNPTAATPGSPTPWATLTVNGPNHTSQNRHLLGLSFDSSGHLWGAYAGPQSGPNGTGRLRRSALYELTAGENSSTTCCSTAAVWPVWGGCYQMITDTSGKLICGATSRGVGGHSILQGALAMAITASPSAIAPIGTQLIHGTGIQAGPIVGVIQSILQMNGRPAGASLFPVQILGTSPLTWRSFPDASGNKTIQTWAVPEPFTYDSRGGGGNGTFIFGQLARIACCGLGWVDGAAGVHTQMSSGGYSDIGVINPEGDLVEGSVWGGPANAPLQIFPGALASPGTAQANGAQVPMNWPYQPVF